MHLLYYSSNFWKTPWKSSCVSFIAYRSSKVSSHPDCIFEIHQLWQSGFSRVYSNCCSFEREIIKIGQSSHKMYSNNILNFQESTTILYTCTKKVWKLIECSTYINFIHILFMMMMMIIMSCCRHRYPWPSLATSPYHSSPLAGLQGHIPYPHVAAVCMFELVILLLLGHMRGSIGVHHLWTHPCFFSSVLHVLFV